MQGRKSHKACNYGSICGPKLLFDYLKAAIKQAGNVKRKNTSSLCTAKSENISIEAFWILIKMFFNKQPIVHGFAIYQQVSAILDGFYRCRFETAALLWKRFLKSFGVIELRRSQQSTAI